MILLWLWLWVSVYAGLGELYLAVTDDIPFLTSVVYSLLMFLFWPARLWVIMVEATRK